MQVIGLKCENQNKPLAVDTSSPRFGWVIKTSGYNIIQKTYRIVVSSQKELLINNMPDMWDSGTVKSSNSICVKYEGETLLSKKTYWWKVFVKTNDGNEASSEIESFGMGLLDEADWGCSFIGLDPVHTAVSKEAEGKAGMPSPYLRKGITIHKDIESAKAFVTALGLYELRINGSKAGNYEMAPGWTDYNKSLQYQAYDVTNLLQKGENALAAILGDGWFTGNIACVGRNQYGDYPLGFRMHISVEYVDGTVDTFMTNTDWKGTTGAIVYSDIQTGEFIDARKELIGWDMPDFDDSLWGSAVTKNDYSNIRCKANIGPPVQVVCEKEPISMKADGNGQYIFDMGQNMVGRISFKLKGVAGQRVTFRYGEMLKDDGTLYVENLRTALQTDVYISAGHKTGEIFEPKFTFHGFRYVEVNGLDYSPSISDLTGKVIYSNCELTGKIETSDKMINQLFSNQLWGQKGNFLSVPTDCPQRDERMGWTGDAQIFANTACYNMDCKGFYEKYLEDCLEAQKPNGAITDVVPNVKHNNGNDLVGNGNAAWGDAVFVIPSVIYQMYGDTTVLNQAYSAMCRYLKYLENTTSKLLRPDYGYGDWLNVDEDTPKDVMSTAYFAYGAKITADIAQILGKKQDAAQFNQLFIKIKRAFRKAYVNRDGFIKGDTQCCYILALKMDLLSSAMKPKVVEHLVRTIKRRNWHLSTGFVGVSYLLPVLSENGYNDVAYRLLLNETYPSWGYSIKNGATTIWERWNSYTVEQGFGDVGMNSFNHYSLGSVGEWMYRYMGGIEAMKPGFKEIRIRPMIDKKIEHAFVSYESIHGTIESNWFKKAGKTFINITIPVNTKAQIFLSSDYIVKVSSEITKIKQQKDYNIYFIGSGAYSFELLKQEEFVGIEEVGFIPELV